MSLWMIPVACGALSFLQTQPVHAAGIPASARHIPGLRVGARDLPVIPAACQVGCAPFAPFFGGAACPVTQCCSTLFEAGYFECFKCVGTATNATDFSIAQEYVDVLTTSCITEGFTLPVLTLPGQNPNRTLVSALPPGASAIPVFPAEGSGPVVRPSTTTSQLSPSHALTTASHSPSQSGAASVSGQTSRASNQTPPSSASGASQSANPPSSASGSVPAQSTVTAPPTQTSSVPSTSVPSASAPPNAGVRVRSGPYVGLGIATLFALLLY